MTISADYAPNIDLGNGTTKAFAVNFPFGDPADLAVTIFDIGAGVDLVPAPALGGMGTYDYTVTGTPNDPGTGIYPNGTVTFNTAPPGNTKVVRGRATPQFQEVVLIDNARFPAKAVEGGLDHLELQIQEIESSLGRAIVAPDSDGPVNLVLPPEEVRADTVLTFDDIGNVANPGIATGPLEAAIAAFLGGKVSPAPTVAGWAKTLAAAKALYVVSVVLSDGQAMVVACRNSINDGYGGRFIYDANDTTSTFAQDGLGFVDTAGRRWKRSYDGAINVKWFGAKGDGVTDDAAAFTAAIVAAAQAMVPDGTYILNTAIEVSAGKKLCLSAGTILLRPAAAAATTPVVYVIGIGAELYGGTIQTQKASPGGVVCLGHKSQTDNRNAWWWRFENCDVKGLDTAGNIGVNVPSGQVTNGPSAANYFGCIQNINIFGADIGLLFSEYANAHNASHIQYWDCRTACLELRGAYANNIVGQFMHTGAASGLFGVKLSNATVGSQESSLNTILGFTVETGGAADISVVIATNPNKNTIVGNDNVLGGFSISNVDNLTILSGIIRTGLDAIFQSTEINVKHIIRNTSVATRQSVDESNSTINAIAVDQTLALKTKVRSGLLILRNASDGGTAMVMCDDLSGAILINGGGFAVVGADPGAGSNKFWVVADGTSTRITNRYGAPKHIDVRTVSASG